MDGKRGVRRDDLGDNGVNDGLQGVSSSGGDGFQGAGINALDLFGIELAQGGDRVYQ